MRGSLNQNFKICVRIKPVQYPSDIIDNTTDSTIVLNNMQNKRGDDQDIYDFHRVFDESTSQKHIFSYCLDNIISRAVAGNNCSVICYGQTGSGKSFTLLGDDERFTFENMNSRTDLGEEKAGLIPNTVSYLLYNYASGEYSDKVISCSFVEVHMDKIRDLSRGMSPTKTSTNKLKMANIAKQVINEVKGLELVENSLGQVHLKDLTIVPITSMSDFYAFLNHGLKQRQNYGRPKQENRSHSIITVYISKKSGSSIDLNSEKSMIQFVDLAGSERVLKNLTEGDIEERLHVSNGLQKLSKILSELSQGNKNLSYKESILTQILFPTMGAYSSSLLMCHINPVRNNYDETRMTLEFADRIKNGYREHKPHQQMYATHENLDVDHMVEKKIKAVQDEVQEQKNKFEAMMKVDILKKFMQRQIN